MIPPSLTDLEVREKAQNERRDEKVTDKVSRLLVFGGGNFPPPPKKKELRCLGVWRGKGFFSGKSIGDGKTRPLKQLEHGKSIGDDGVPEII